MPCAQVRCSNLQELVYKQGQAGIQKATVTLVFDNRDAEGSPLGYEQYDEITIARQVRASRLFSGAADAAAARQQPRSPLRPHPPPGALRHARRWHARRDRAACAHEATSAGPRLAALRQRACRGLQLACAQVPTPRRW